MKFSMPASTPEAFVAAVKEEHARAVAKFPGTNLTMMALTEEVGELAQALLHIREGKHPSTEVGAQRVWEEAVQVAVMAMRVATEGDPTIFV